MAMYLQGKLHKINHFFLFFKIFKLQNKIIIILRSQDLICTPYAKIKCGNQMIYNKKNNTILVVLERIPYGSTFESIHMKEA